MAPHSLSTYLLLSLTSLVAAQKVTFEGRVPAGTKVASFDANNGLFNPSNVFGANLSFSKVLQLPSVSPSLFDVGTVPLEVTIKYAPDKGSHNVSTRHILTFLLSDQSIFAPSATNIQTGFRRAELIPASNNGTDPSTTGVQTLHFSLMKDAQRPLNLSHEYQMVKSILYITLLQRKPDFLYKSYDSAPKLTPDCLGIPREQRFQYKPGGAEDRNHLGSEHLKSRCFDALFKC